MLYRIFTENINKPGIEKIINNYFPGYTMITAEGSWNRIKENSLIIEITDPNLDKNIANKMADDIKILNNQQSVLIQQIPNDSWLV